MYSVQHAGCRACLERTYCAPQSVWEAVETVSQTRGCLYVSTRTVVEQVQPGLCSAFRHLISCTRHSLLPLINSDIGKCVGLGADETIFEPGF